MCVRFTLLEVGFCLELRELGEFEELEQGFIFGVNALIFFNWAILYALGLLFLALRRSTRFMLCGRI